MIGWAGQRSAELLGVVDAFYAYGLGAEFG
jgi:hypothetical protein